MGNLSAKTVEYNGQSKVVLVGAAKLVAPLSNKTLEYTNGANQKKEYKLATIEVVTPNGKVTEMLASVAMRNIELMEEADAKFEVGASYLATIDRVEDRNNPGKFIALARLSHLRGVEVNAEAMDELTAMFDDIDAAPVAAPKLQEAAEEVE